MRKDYWDNVARNFEDEIFSVYDHDTAGLIKAAIGRYGGRNKTASDIGCGTGSFLPLMSESFKSVDAIDISPKVLYRAQKAYTKLGNVSFRVADLSRPKTELPKVDACLCVNVLLTPSLGHRIRMLDALCGQIRPNGHLILVVPSLESAMLTHQRLIEWNLREGTPPSHASVARFSKFSPPEAARLRAGIVNVDGVPHKHYLQEEICHSLAERNVEVTEAGKIAYSWDTEFENPPEWMQTPLPWDWLVIGKKK